MEYYSAIFNNELSHHTKKLINLKEISLSEKSQWNTTGSTIQIIWYSGKDKTIVTVKRSVVAMVSRERGKGYKVRHTGLFLE